MSPWFVWAFLGVGVTVAVVEAAALASRAVTSWRRRRHPCRTCLGSGLLVTPGGHLHYCPTCNPKKEP